MPMIAITTKSSTNVKPVRLFFYSAAVLTLPELFIFLLSTVLLFALFYEMFYQKSRSQPPEIEPPLLLRRFSLLSRSPSRAFRFQNSEGVT